MHVRRACGGEVAFVGVVRAFAVVDMLDQLGDEEIQVRVTLAVPVARQIERHAVDMDREVGAMVEVEAAQEILIRLARAAVLGDDHAGDDLQHLAGPQQRPVLELLVVDGSLAGRVGFAGKSVLAGRYQHRIASGYACRERILHHHAGRKRDKHAPHAAHQNPLHELPSADRSAVTIERELLLQEIAEQLGGRSGPCGMCAASFAAGSARIAPGRDCEGKPNAAAVDASSGPNAARLSSPAARAALREALSTSIASSPAAWWWRATCACP